MKNILLITSDQHRKDSIGVYSPSGIASTPSLDALAADGIIFDRAYTPHATCTPARASILTGQYASRHGAYTIGTALSLDCLKVTDKFNDAGYETYAVGKMHFRPVSTEGEYESSPQIFDENFWKTNSEPYYGFKHIELLNRHSTDSLACRMNYALWLKDKHGLTESDLKKYFNDMELGRWDIPPEYHQSEFVAEKTIDAISQHTDNSSPFFIWASFPDPHWPLAVPPPYDEMFDPAKVSYTPYKEGEFDDKPKFYQMLYDAKHPTELPFSDKIGIPSAYSCKDNSEEYLRKCISVHHGMVTLMDEKIGKIIGALKSQGLYENTIIIFTSDHGDTLGNHGFFGKGFPAYEEVYNIPFIIKNAGLAHPDKKRSSKLCGLVDIAPTLLDLNELDIPSEMQGISLAPEIKGEPGKNRTAFVIENRLIEKGFYQQMLITDRYKIVVYKDELDGELYDLQEDRDQYCNLWNSISHKNIKIDLLSELLNFYNHNVSKDIKDEKALLKHIFVRMESEGAVQKRTSFS